VRRDLRNFIVTVVTRAGARRSLLLTFTHASLRAPRSV
jgi:hypothetical protein